ncbi:hypothetical protein EMPS_05076 [Entomortierella parvispora]|uniref:F-box domain-containing protein n=1 Tax=Entomortierella parvispora TaxID=205924 RepID=A0A9P3HA66_9FUNG|nr:hypothetical protein EMPS_05076 [Entomortierella parvispora]
MTLLPSKSKISRPPQGCSPVFDLPEILENIFDHLSPHKRRTVASLVCKQWFAVARHFSLPTDFVWDIMATQEQRLLVLQHTITASYRTLIFRGHDQRHRDHTRHGNDIENTSEPVREPSDLALKELRQISTESSSTAKLRELVLDHSISWEMSKVFELLEMTGHALRILRLVHSQPILPETVATILLSCPQLDTLSILMPPEQRISRSSPGVPPAPSAQSSFVLEAAMKARLPLRNLILQQPLMVDTLLDLILSLSYLTQLRVLDGVLAMSTAEDGPPIAILLDLTAFLAQLNLVCPMLYRLQLSCQGNLGATSSVLLSQGLFTARGPTSPEKGVGTELANIKELSFQDTELSGGEILPPSKLMLAMLAPLTSARVTPIQGRPRLWAFGHLTRLEILPSNHEKGLVQSFQSLHTFLCHAPNLEHLIAPNVMIDYEDLDWELVLLPLKAMKYTQDAALIPVGDDPNEAFRGLGELARQRAKKKAYDARKKDRLQPSQKPSTPPTHVWACRRLRTLHIAFPEPNYPDNAARSLILFGYISKACPRLLDLQITKETINFRPKDGLCLLSRLHDLERLTFVTTHVHFFDPRTATEIQGGKKLFQTFEDELEWMRRFPKGYNGRSFATLSTGISFSSLEDSRQDIFQGRGTPISRNKGRDQGWDDLNLSSLGTLRDVKDWKSERTRDLMNCRPLWPALESLQVRYSNAEYRNEGRKLQHYLAKIRPDVRSDILYSKGEPFPPVRVA